jgi:hypothetical protein
MSKGEVIWCLGLWEEDTDYVLCDWDIDLLPELYQQDQIRYEYNQGNQSWSIKSCTIFAAMWMLSDLMNYEFSLDELKEVDNLSYEHGRVKWQGWWVKSAVDLVAKWWNEKHRDLWMVAYYRVSKYSDMVDKIIEKWYTLDTNYCPTVEYAKDYYLDWVLEGTEFWTKTNWHSVCVINDWVRKIKDNYKWRKNPSWKDVNIYEVKNQIAKITNYWPYLYLFTKVQEDNMQEIKRLNEIKAKCNVIINHLSGLRNMVNDTNFQWILHYTAEKLRKKINDANEQLKKYI